MLMTKLPSILNVNLALIELMLSNEGYSVRVVGGAVRDMLMGIKPKDIDLCTDATPDEVVRIAEVVNTRMVAEGVARPDEKIINIIPTGLQHGTVTLVINHEPYEITTLRIDTETDGRHAEVEFTTSFEQDAERRDLTINAMSMDFDGTVYDYFNGVEDLNNRVVCFVGNAKSRIEEDYLRVLRYFRFAARFSATMEQDTLDLFNTPDTHEGLSKISAERVWLEMQKLLVMPDRLRVMLQVEFTGIAKVIGLPNPISPSLAHADDAIAALSTFVNTVDEAFELANRWKLSTAEKNKLVWLAGVEPLDHVINQDYLVEGVARDYLISAVKLQLRDHLIHYINNFEIPVFPVRGVDLIERGVKPGPDMGLRLKAMRDDWVASRYSKTKAQLIN